MRGCVRRWVVFAWVAAAAGCGVAPSATVLVPTRVANWPGHRGAVHGLAVVGDRVVSVADDGRLLVRDVTTGDLLDELAGHAGAWAVAATADDVVVVAGGDGRLTTWRWPTGERETFGPDGGMAEGATCIAVSTDGHLALTGGYDSRVRLWDVPGRRLLADWQGHADTVFCVAFAPDGVHAWSGSFDGTVRVWRVADGAEVRVLGASERRGWQRALLADADDDFLHAFGPPVPTRWDLVRGVGEPYVGAHENALLCAARSPDGLWIATGSAAGDLLLWDPATRSLRARWPAGQGRMVWAVTFLGDGRLVSAGDDGTVSVWRLDRR